MENHLKACSKLHILVTDEKKCSIAGFMCIQLVSKIRILVALLLLISTNAVAINSNHFCESLFGLNRLDSDQQNYNARSDAPSRKKIISKKAKGYIIIISAMTATTALSFFVTSNLPKDFQFLSQPIGNISALVNVGLAAPIWSPLISKYRKYGFMLLEEEQNPKIGNKYLDRIWDTTQKLYSINEQMSRNVVHAYLLAAQPIFIEAHKSFVDGDENFAIKLVADIAVRLRHLFLEIEPNDEHVSRAVKVSFIDQIDETSKEEIKRRIFQEIKKMDEDTFHMTVKNYYIKLLESWF